MRKLKQRIQQIQPFLPWIWLLMCLQQVTMIVFHGRGFWYWITTACAFYNFYEGTHPNFQPGKALAKKVKARLEQHD